MGSLESLNSLESLGNGPSQKTPFPKDPFFRTRNTGEEASKIHGLCGPKVDSAQRSAPHLSPFQRDPPTLRAQVCEQGMLVANGCGGPPFICASEQVSLPLVGNCKHVPAKVIRAESRGTGAVLSMYLVCKQLMGVVGGGALRGR